MPILGCFDTFGVPWQKALHMPDDLGQVQSSSVCHWNCSNKLQQGPTYALLCRPSKRRSAEARLVMWAWNLDWILIQCDSVFLKALCLADVSICFLWSPTPLPWDYWSPQVCDFRIGSTEAQEKKKNGRPVARVAAMIIQLSGYQLDIT